MAKLKSRRSRTSIWYSRSDEIRRLLRECDGNVSAVARCYSITRERMRTVLKKLNINPEALREARRLRRDAVELIRRAARATERFRKRNSDGQLCPRCLNFKPYSEFHKDKSQRSGHCAYCKTCKGKMVAEWAHRPENVVHLLEYRKVHATQIRENSRRHYFAKKAERQAAAGGGAGVGENSA